MIQQLLISVISVYVVIMYTRHDNKEFQSNQSYIIL